MKILWLSWKDIKHPQAGGAEVVTHNLLKRLVADGHEVILLTSQPQGSSKTDEIDGYKVIRNGNKFTVYPKTATYFKKNLKDWPNKIIEEINTIPFFSQSYASQPKFLFFHQLAREIWFYQMQWPLSKIGYWLEPKYLKGLGKQKVITISKSTKDDLIKHGFKSGNIKIITQGMELTPLANIDKVKKFTKPTILALGSVRPMKRTDQVLKAYEFFRSAGGKAELIIAGNITGDYGDLVKELVKKSKFSSDIQVLGSVSDPKKIELMQRSHILAIASLKEGWGLTATEANSQGTPVIAYDVDGLRDSVKNNQTGLICEPNPKALANAMLKIFNDKKLYERLRQAAWQDSRQYNFDSTYKDFKEVIGL